MEIKVLGSGCAKCKKLYAEAQEAVARSGQAASVVPCLLSFLSCVDAVFEDPDADRVELPALGPATRSRDGQGSRRRRSWAGGWRRMRAAAAARRLE